VRTRFSTVLITIVVLASAACTTAGDDVAVDDARADETQPEEARAGDARRTGRCAVLTEPVVFEDEATGVGDDPPMVPAAAGLVALWVPDAHDVVVVFEPAATAADFAPVVAQLEELGGPVTLTSGEDALGELRRLLPDRSDLLDGLAPALLPASARLQLQAPADLAALRLLPAVRELRTTYDSATIDDLVATTAGTDLAAALATDDPLAADAAVLDEAARRWSGADPAARTRGSVFSDEERAGAAVAADRLVAGLLADCGVGLGATRRGGG